MRDMDRFVNTEVQASTIEIERPVQPIRFQGTAQELDSERLHCVQSFRLIVNVHGYSHSFQCLTHTSSHPTIVSKYHAEGPSDCPDPAKTNEPSGSCIYCLARIQPSKITLRIATDIVQEYGLKRLADLSSVRVSKRTGPSDLHSLGVPIPTKKSCDITRKLLATENSCSRDANQMGSFRIIAGQTRHE